MNLRKLQKEGKLQFQRQPCLKMSFTKLKMGSNSCELHRLYKSYQLTAEVK